LTTWTNGEISLGNLSALANVRGKPAVVFHLAGGSSVGAALAQPREDFARTVNATAELLEWVRLESPGTAVVVTSSAAVYGSGHAHPIGEQVATKPFSPYGAHKLLMELLCASYGASFGVRTAVGRVFSAYGGGLRKQLLWDVCSRLETGESDLVLGGDGEELRDYVHVRDVARAIGALGNEVSPAAPLFNIGTGRATSVRTLVSLLMDRWQTSVGASQNLSLSFSGKSRPGDPRYLVADTERLSALGVTCETPIELGVSEYVRWFRARQTEAD
jgi:UDP-glucose 4-epimerase